MQRRDPRRQLAEDLDGPQCRREDRHRDGSPHDRDECRGGTEPPGGCNRHQREAHRAYDERLEAGLAQAGHGLDGSA